MESDYNDSCHIIGNEQMVPGLQMASKAFINICVVELGKPYVLPELGRNFARTNDGVRGYRRW